MDDLLKMISHMAEGVDDGQLIRIGERDLDADKLPPTPLIGAAGVGVSAPCLATITFRFQCRQVLFASCVIHDTGGHSDDDDDVIEN